MNAAATQASFPLLVQLLHLHPDVRVKVLPQRPGLSLFHVDFGRTLYLADANDVLLIHVEMPLASLSEAEQLLEFISSYAPRDQIKLLSLPGYRPGSPLARLLALYPNLAVVETTELERQAVDEGFEVAVAHALRSGIELLRLQLYQYRGAVTGNRFFGREHQVQAILRRPHVSYLVTGPRMSGKTSLLLEAQRQLSNYYSGAQASKAVGLVYADCREATSIAGLFQSILIQLEERTSFARVERWTASDNWPQFFRYLRTRARRSAHRRLYVFLDEYDHVVEMEGNLDTESKLSWQFRALYQQNSTERGIIQFVFAGSKYLAAAQKNLSSGLHNFVNPEECKLDNFDIGTVRTVLQRPLRDLGMEVEDPQTVANELLRYTGGRPASVQYVCYQMLRRAMERQHRRVTLDDLREVVNSSGYLQYYDASLRENTDPLEMFVLAAGERVMERKAGFTLEDIISASQRYGLSVEEKEVYESLVDLDNSGFIRLQDDRVRAPYVIAAPVIRQLAQRRDLEQLARTIRRSSGGGS